MTLHEGVDPGQDEAARVILSWDPSTRRATVVEGASYERTKRNRVRGWLVTTWGPGGPVSESWTGDYGEAIRLFTVSEHRADTLAVEGAAWHARGKVTSASIASLSVARGRTLQALGRPALEPLAEVWRPVVLRCSRTTSGDAAKGLAVAHVTGRRVLRQNPITWSVEWPAGVRCRSHEAEAVCVAMYPVLVDGA